MRDDVNIDPRALFQMTGELDVASLRDMILKALGPGENAGDMATATATPIGTETFAPNHLCLLYIRVDAGMILFRHAYLDISKISHDKDTLGKLASPLFAGMATNRPNLGQLIRYTNGPAKFSFGSQHIVMILLDNPESVARFNDSVSMDDVIRFSKFRSGPYGQMAKPNTNFYNLRPGPDIPGLDGSQTYLLDYWNRDERGNNIVVDPNKPSDYYIHSMNIYLLMATERFATYPAEPSPLPFPSSWIPVIVDPDTGNMGTTP